jgi:Tar ligand binding domain homologue
MNAFKVSTRLALLVGLCATLLTLVGVAGLWGLASSNKALRTVYDDRVVPLRQLAEIQRRQLDSQIVVEAALADANPAGTRAAVTRVEDNVAEITKLWTAYMATHLTPEEAQLAQKLAELRKHYVAEGLRPALDALRAGDAKRTQQATAQMRTLYGDVRPVLEALLKLQVDVAASENAASRARYDVLRYAGLATMLLGLLTMAGTGLLIARSLIRELGAEPSQAAALARRVARATATA